MNVFVNAFISAGGKAPYDPARSVHPFLPHVPELIWGTLSSLIVFALLYKVGAPMLKKGIAERAERIEGEIAAARADREQAQTEAADLRSGAGDVDAVRSKSLAEADAEAADILSKGRASLEQEVADLKSRGDQDVAARATRAQDSVKSEISRVSTRAAENIISSDWIDDAAHQELIESFIRKVGAN